MKLEKALNKIEHIVNGDAKFENILNKPLYVNLAKDKINEQLVIDLTSQNIQVNGDFLVTIEQVKNLGQGKLYFCGSLLNSTYHRETSQDKWMKIDLVGMIISAEVRIEK